MKRLITPALLSLLSAPALSSSIFINELHYDNSGGDTGEAIEIAGASGTDLSSYRIVLYNGNGGRVYNTENLSGVIPNQQDGFGTLSFAISGIQNGSPDGIVLVDSNDNIIQFLSYEGTMTATDGVAVGLDSTDILVSEASSTPVGFSLQLVGTGSQSSDFVWQDASTASFGDINTGQTFQGDGPVIDTAPVVISTTPADNTGAVAVDDTIDISFNEAVNVQSGWYTINCSKSGNVFATVAGGPQHYTLTPDNNFAENEVCTVVVNAALVNDVDVNDGADFMEADFSFRFGTKVNTPIIINEVDADTAGFDTEEFVELYDGGVGNTPLDGLVLVRYNGSDNRSYGDAIDLDGFSTNADGFFVIGNTDVTSATIIVDSNSLQNGADAVALHAGDGVDYPNDTPVSGLSIVDALVYDTNDSDDNDLVSVLTPGQNQLNEGGNGNKDFDANARVPDGGAALDTSNYIQQAPTPGISNVPKVAIYEIQGRGLSSPFEGSIVETLNNVVTAVGPEGFFMQTPAANSDNDIETSDGIYVFTNNAPNVSVGDAVNVVGKVVEFFGFTEFDDTADVTVVSLTNPIPSAVIFDENVPSSNQPQPANELERFEGMVVSFTGTTTAATDRFGDVAVVAGNQRTFREPGIEFPGIPGLPVWDGNPEVFELNVDELGLANQSFFAGQSISATGVLGFSFGDYQVWPTAVDVGPVPDLQAPVRMKSNDEFTVGALNLLRPSERASEIDARFIKISRFIREIMNAPDILAVSEVASVEVLQSIADRINMDDSSIQYTAYLEEGNDFGGIDVGFLVRRSVSVERVTQFGKDTVFDFDGNLLNDRPPLLIEARITSDGSDFPIQVLALHNRSLSRIDSSERVRQKRLAQAQFVANLVQDIQTNNPDVNLVVTGDLNAYQFTDGYVDVLGQIAGTAVESDNLRWEPSPVFPQLTNFVNQIPQSEQYSFIFGGNSQVLDHALTTQNLVSLVSDFKFARGNADAPTGLLTDITTTLRASDHDGLVLYIKKDSDNDGVLDSQDLCPATRIPETAPSKGLKPNHFALLDFDAMFDTEGSVKNTFSISDTAGCSCEQIIVERNLGKGHAKHGCSVGVMRSWAKSVAN